MKEPEVRTFSSHVRHLKRGSGKIREEKTSENRGSWKGIELIGCGYSRDARSKGEAEEEGLGGQGGGGGEQAKITDDAEVGDEKEEEEQEQERRRKDVDIERSANDGTRSHESILSESQELLRIRPSSLNVCSASACST